MFNLPVVVLIDLKKACDTVDKNKKKDNKKDNKDNKKETLRRKTSQIQK